MIILNGGGHQDTLGKNVENRDILRFSRYFGTAQLETGDNPLAKQGDIFSLRREESVILSGPASFFLFFPPTHFQLPAERNNLTCINPSPPENYS